MSSEVQDPKIRLRRRKLLEGGAWLVAVAVSVTAVVTMHSAAAQPFHTTLNDPLALPISLTSRGQDPNVPLPPVGAVTPSTDAMSPADAARSAVGAVPDVTTAPNKTTSTTGTTVVGQAPAVIDPTVSPGAQVVPLQSPSTPVTSPPTQPTTPVTPTQPPVTAAPVTTTTAPPATTTTASTAPPVLVTTSLPDRANGASTDDSAQSSALDTITSLLSPQQSRGHRR